ncbi:glycosyltransferase [Vibrio alginolyticus]|uniref:glycosyltransferase n=1 Tax=Vibrio alginolyticus TaxID=663 RepID=UPI003066AE3D|nr:glycosyltransferase [Vibrio alginolyticus]
MRIAIYSNSFPNTSETFVINQAIELIRLGVEVSIVTNKRNFESSVHENVKKYDLSSKTTGLVKSNFGSKLGWLCCAIKLVFFLLFSGKVKETFSVVFDVNLSNLQKVYLLDILHYGKFSLDFDIVICHFGNHGYYLCKMRELGIISGKVATIFHGYEISKKIVLKKYKNNYLSLFEKGDVMLPISKFWKEKLISLGCSENKVTVSRMGIDIEDFNFKPLPFVKGEALKLIQVGRLTEKKAILNTIKAVSLVRHEIPVHLKIIGSGELEFEAEELIRKLELSSCVTLLGQKSSDEVKKELRNSHVFLLPSVTAVDGDMEGIPVALMEAMARGLIVISTFHSGIPELIDDNVTGFLVEEHDVKGLAEKIKEVYSTPANALDDIRLMALSKCKKDFNNKSITNNLIKMLDNLE